MNRAGILPGDVVVFDPCQFPRHNDIVIAEVYGQGTTVKRLRQTRLGYGMSGRSWLVPESDDPRWRPMLIDEAVRLLGVVVEIQRSIEGVAMQRTKQG